MNVQELNDQLIAKIKMQIARIEGKIEEITYLAQAIEALERKLEAHGRKMPVEVTNILDASRLTLQNFKHELDLNNEVLSIVVSGDKSRASLLRLLDLMKELHEMDSMAPMQVVRNSPKFQAYASKMGLPIDEDDMEPSTPKGGLN